MATADRYITGKMHGIQGFLSQADAYLWKEILDYQTTRGLDGDLAEIGVYFGRSYILMALLAGSGEKVFGCDLFIVSSGKNGKRRSQYRVFLDNAEQVGIGIDESCIYTGDSGDLDLTEIKRTFAPIRFFSIDGGHYIEHIRTDSAVATEALHEGGIIAFDDFCNPQWPEVTYGIYEFLDRHDDAYQMFAVSRKKAYIARAEYVEEYAEAVRKSPSLQSARLENVRFKGREIPFVNESYATILKQKANDVLGRSMLRVMT